MIDLLGEVINSNLDKTPFKIVELNDKRLKGTSRAKLVKTCSM
jgi:hypothetical protein